MTDVVVVFLALVALTLFGLSAWVSVIVFRRTRRGEDIVPPSYPFGGHLLGGGSSRTPDESWRLDGGDGSGGGGGGT